MNGVFLVALCLSIFLEAIQRLVEPQEVKNPRLVLTVGSFGLLSNIFGLLLFHEHDHGKGEDALHMAEQGHVQERTTADVADERGSVASVVPENVVGAPRADEGDVGDRPQVIGGRSRPATKPSAREVAAVPTPRVHNRRARAFSGSGQRGFGSVDNIHVHPADRYQDIIKASRFQDDDYESSETSRDGEQDEDGEVTERSKLLGPGGRVRNYTDETASAPGDTSGANGDEAAAADRHRTHNHARAQHKKGQAKSQGDLNMRGVFLHVVGDALGNIGVITSALVIWLTDFSWRHYVDPGISLLITGIILTTAIPLCKAASRILLQAVPVGMSIDHIQEDINSIPGIVDSHHLHVWQLSDTKLVASLHIRISSEIKDEGSESYMRLAKEVRRCLHAYGIHSSTIQPEFLPATPNGHADFEDGTTVAASPPSVAQQHPEDSRSAPSSPTASPLNGANDGRCLIGCGSECPGGKCCP